MFSFSKILKYVWPQMRKYSKSFYSIISLYTVRIILNSIFVPFYFKKIIDILSHSDISRVVLSQSLFELVFIIVGLNITATLIIRIGKFLFMAFEIDVIRELRNFSFQKIEQNSHTFFANIFAGSLVTKSRRFIGAFENMFDIFIYDFLIFFIILTGVFTVLVRESTIIGLIFFVWVVLHIIIFSFFVKKKINYDMLEAEQDSKISGRLADIFSNISAVKFFSARDKEIDSFGKYTEEGRARSKKAWFFGGKIDIFQGAFIIVVQSIMLYVMVSFWIKNQISTGTIVLIQTYMVIVFERLWNFGNALTKFMKSASDMKEMVDIFEIIPDILDPESPEKLKMKKGHIMFKNVSFKY